MNDTVYNDGFNAGFVQLRIKDKRAATTELWAALGINNRVSFSQYLYGQIEPKASQAAAIENVLAKYGVTKNIWGK